MKKKDKDLIHAAELGRNEAVMDENTQVTMAEYDCAVSSLTEGMTDVADENRRLRGYVAVLQRENTRLKRMMKLL